MIGPPVFQENGMTRTTLTIIIGLSLSSMNGVARAGDNTSHPSLAPITVQQDQWARTASAVSLGDCTPPTDRKACSQLHAQIRSQFSKREIGMLFGAATAYPEYRTSYSRVEDRYQVFLRDYKASNQAAVAVAAAGQ